MKESQRDQTVSDMPCPGKERSNKREIKQLVARTYSGNLNGKTSILAISGTY